jgi:hypothetical protein
MTEFFDFVNLPALLTPPLLRRPATTGSGRLEQGGAATVISSPKLKGRTTLKLRLFFAAVCHGLPSRAEAQHN